jgi:hypothetical protein
MTRSRQWLPQPDPQSHDSPLNNNDEQGNDT